MRNEFDAPPFLSRYLAYLTLPIYLSAAGIHRIFGSREDHHLGAWEDRLCYGYFLQGFPALAGGLAAVAVGFVAWRNAPNADAKYTAQAAAALNAQDYSAAEVCFTRLLGLRPDDPRYRFGLGDVVAKQGDPVRAEQLIAPLAPDDHIGYAPAHLWMVDRMLQHDGAVARLDAQQIGMVEKHLIRLRDNPELRDRARATLMGLYVHTNRVGMVLDDPELRAVAEQTPETKLALVQELANRGRAAETDVMLAELIRAFTAQLRENRDDVTTRERLCKSLALSGDLRTAVATADEGLKLNPDGPFGALLADLMAARAAEVRNLAGLTESERRNTYRGAVELLQKHGRESTATHLKVAELARWLGDKPEVERRLQKAADDLPAARLQLADFYSTEGRDDEADAQWRLIAQRYDRLPEPERLALGERMLAAAAALSQQRFADAEKLLDFATSDPGAVGLKTRVYVEWVDDLTSKPQTETGTEQFDLLKKALVPDPWNPSVIQRLLRLARTNEQMSATVRSFLVGKVAEGNVSAAAYLMLGTEALQRGDRDSARSYLDRAYQLRPDAVDVLNNLAWALLTDDPPEPDRALELITAALQRAPTDPRVLDTRFRIYSKLGRWNEALADLEECTAAMTGNREFHLAAAEVYDHVNLPDIAAEHRRRAAVAKPTSP